MSSRQLTLILPGGWWRIPLVDPKARHKAITNLAKACFGHNDQRAELRHDFSVQLSKVADQASLLGGVLFGVYMMQYDDHPFSATMLCYDVAGRLPLPKDLDPVLVLAHWVGDAELEASRPQPDVQVPSAPGELVSPVADEVPDQVNPPAPKGAITGSHPLDDAPWVRVADFDVVAYRRDFVGPGPAEFGPDGTEIPQLRVSYISAVPGFGLVQTTFSTAFPQARDAWLLMFDAIVAGLGTTERVMEDTDDIASGS